MSMFVHDLGLSRRACDRCHGQKLRCRRENVSEGCIRCARAGVQCTPRPIRSRRRGRSNAAQPAPVHQDTASVTQTMGKRPSLEGGEFIAQIIRELTLWKGSPAAEQTSKDISEQFSLWPASLRDMPPDLDMGLDSFTLQSEIDPTLEPRVLQSGMDLVAPPSRHSSQPSAQETPRGRNSGERSEQGHQNGVHDASQDISSSSILSSFVSTLLPCDTEARPPSYTRHRLSLAREPTPEHRNGTSQGEAGVSVMNFDQRESTTHSSDSEDTGSDSSYSRVALSRRQSTNSDTLRGSYNPEQQKIQKQLPEPAMTSWIRKLSDINVDLHRHMLSIPPIGTWQNTSWAHTRDSAERKRNGSTASCSLSDKELAVDDTFQLSHQYTDLLNDIFSQFKTRRMYTEQTATAALPATISLDQPSQLLILSSYLCLVESYDKIVQHIKSWTEIRLKMGTSSSDEHFPIQLPSLAIGSFKTPTTSSTRPLVLTCMIEAMIMHMHDLISQMMRPGNTGLAESRASGRNSSSNTSGGEQNSTTGQSDDGLSSVTRVTLQAIRAKEASTMKLIHVVWKLALRCGVP